MQGNNHDKEASDRSCGSNHEKSRLSAPWLANNVSYIALQYMVRDQLCLLA